MTIPFPTSTHLCLEKKAKLLQTLVDLKEECGSDFPEEIQLCVTELLDAQEKLVKQIDSYMHSGNHASNEVEAMTAIIETFPEFLSTNDQEKGGLPIQCYANNDSEPITGSTVVPLLANLGVEHGVGGEDGRGGLLLEHKNGKNLLQCLAARQCVDVMESLRNAEPPLLVKEDVREFYLLHEAVRGKNFEMVKFMVEFDDSCLYDRDEKSRTPLSYMCCCPEENDEVDEEECLDMVQYLLREGILYDVFDPTIGGLFTKVEYDELVLDGLLRRYGEEKAWKCVELCLLPFVALPILHQTIKYAPHHSCTVLNKFPDSALLRDNQNRLPIHVALESNMEWSKLVPLLRANRPACEKMVSTAMTVFEASLDLMNLYLLLKQHQNDGEISGEATRLFIVRVCSDEKQPN